MKLLTIFLVLLASLIQSQPVKEFRDTKFGFPLNTQNAEYNPVISPNSRYIVFQSNRPGGEGGMDIWLSENTNYKDRTGKPNWADPINFRELNTPSFEGNFAIRFDEKGEPIEIFFTSVKDSNSKRDGFEGLNIYYTKKNPSNGKWKVPEHLNAINSNFEDKMPAISPDGRVLIFSSNRPGGFGGFDLWISYRDLETGNWSKPVNMGKKINSTTNEIMPYFHYDGLSILFSSDRNDENLKFHFYSANFVNSDYIVDPLDNAEKKDAPYYSPANPVRIQEVYKLGKPFNSDGDDEGISLSHDGLWLYYSSNRLGGNGQFDIYRAVVPEDLRKLYPFLLHGIVMDGSEDIMIGLDATLKVYNEKGVVKTVTSKRIGGNLNQRLAENFRTILSTGSLYRIEVSSPGFHPTEVQVDLRGNIEKEKSKYLKIVLVPVKPIEEPKAKEEKPLTEKEKSLEPKAKEVAIILKDYKTKEQITEGVVTMFTEDQKDGVIVSKKKTKFVLEKFPDKDFELLAKANGYKDTTLTIDSTSEIRKKNDEVVIFLRKTKDVEEIYNKVLKFKFNEYVVEEDHKKYLDKLISHLKLNKEDKVEVAGHTDNIASKEFNLWLSTMRAEKVKKYMVEQGIEPKRIKVKGYWYSQPISDNKTEEGRAKNRRVDFKKLD